MKTKIFKGYKILDMKGNQWFISGNYWNDEGEEGLTDIRLFNDHIEIAIETEATIPDFIPEQFINDLIWQLNHEVKHVPDASI